MARPFRFAVQTGPFGDPAALREHAAAVEAHGYDELYSFDHVGGGAPDPFVPLVVAAGATDRLRVGPLVLNNEFHQPALLARTAISVDQMTGGRLVLGIGTGYARSEHDAIGLRLLPPAERVTRLGECLTILRDLLDTGSCRFDGAHHNVEVDDLGLRPVQERVPLLVGGHGRRVVALAAEHADIFQFTGLTHGPDGTPGPGGFGLDEVALRARWLAEAAAARDGSIERSALVQFSSVGADAPTADVLAERFGVDGDVVAETPFVLSGSPDQVVDKLERTRDLLGISHVVVRDVEGFAPVVEALRGR